MKFVFSNEDDMIEAIILVPKFKVTLSINHILRVIYNNLMLPSPNHNLVKLIKIKMTKKYF